MNSSIKIPSWKFIKNPHTLISTRCVCPASQPSQTVDSHAITCIQFRPAIGVLVCAPESFAELFPAKHAKRQSHKNEQREFFLSGIPSKTFNESIKFRRRARAPSPRPRARKINQTKLFHFLNDHQHALWPSRHGCVALKFQSRRSAVWNYECFQWANSSAIW